MTTTPTVHAVTRWARTIIGVMDAAEDPKTVALWGRTIGVSAGCLRNWCATAGLSPKRSLDLARVLRVLYFCNDLPWMPERLLDIADRRTVRKLLERGGLFEQAAPTLEEFIGRQTFIDDKVAVGELARLLTDTTTLHHVAQRRLAPHTDSYTYEEKITGP